MTHDEHRLGRDMCAVTQAKVLELQTISENNESEIFAHMVYAISSLRLSCSSSLACGLVNLFLSHMKNTSPYMLSLLPKPKWDIHSGNHIGSMP